LPTSYNTQDTPTVSAQIQLPNETYVTNRNISFEVQLPNSILQSPQVKLYLLWHDLEVLEDGFVAGNEIIVPSTTARFQHLKLNQMTVIRECLRTKGKLTRKIKKEKVGPFYILLTSATVHMISTPIFLVSHIRLKEEDAREPPVTK